MKIRFELTDDAGKAYTGEVTLRAAGAAKEAKAVLKPTSASSPKHIDPDFNEPFRPFMKQHASGKSGREKFTLVLAHLAKGKVKTEVPLESITKAWNKMKGTLGEFNLAHPVRAKDKGWVDSPKKGVYILLPRWTESLRVDA